MYLICSVWFIFALFLKLDLCNPNLLKGVAVRPIWDFSSSVVAVVASYTMFVVVHFPGSGHSAFFLQLQVPSCFFALVVMLLLWAIIFVSILRIQLSPTFTVFLLVISCAIGAPL